MSKLCQEAREFVRAHAADMGDAGSQFQRAYALVDRLSKRLSDGQLLALDAAAELRQSDGEHARKIVAALDDWQNERL